jgi:O-antigen/teichoic acid export membrane protein
LRWTLQSSQVLKISLFKNISSTLLIAGGIICWAWKSPEVISVMAMTTLISGLWANYSARQYLQLGEIPFDKVKQLLLFSFPLLGLNIFAFCSLTINSFLLAHLTDLHEFGVFSVATIIANIFEGITSGFFWASGPYILLTYKETAAPRKYAELFNMIALIGIVCIVILGLWGEPLVQLVKPGATYQGIGTLIPWILGGTILYYLGAYFSPGPYLSHKTHLNLIVFVAAAIFNLLLSYVLIPRIGIIGAGISVTCSSLLSAVLLQSISHKLFFIPNPWKKTFLVVLLTIIFVSWQQTDAFFYNVNSFSWAGRLMITIILLILALLPFSQEIRNLNLKQQFHHFVGRRLFQGKA